MIHVFDKKLYLIQAFLMHVSKCMMKIFARCFCTRLKIIVYFAVCFELVVTDDVVHRHVLGVSY